MSELQCLLTMLLANTSTVQKLHLASSQLYHDLFCSARDRNVFKEGSIDMQTYAESRCTSDVDGEKSVETSPTDNGDIFQLPPGTVKPHQMLVHHTPTIQM